MHWFHSPKLKLEKYLEIKSFINTQFLHWSNFQLPKIYRYALDDVYSANLLLIATAILMSSQKRQI